MFYFGQTSFSSSPSTQSWSNFAAKGANEIDMASQALQAEMQKEKPNWNVVLKEQQRVQKGKRMLETASNMLQTINNILQKIIDKLQVR